MCNAKVISLIITAVFLVQQVKRKTYKLKEKLFKKRIICRNDIVLY